MKFITEDILMEIRSLILNNHYFGTADPTCYILRCPNECLILKTYLGSVSEDNLKDFNMIKGYVKSKYRIDLEFEIRPISKKEINLIIQQKF